MFINYNFNGRIFHKCLVLFKNHNRKKNIILHLNVFKILTIFIIWATMYKLKTY